MPIFDFNTPAIIGALGTAVSQVNQQVLRQIEATVKQLLPFRSLAITGLVDRPGTYVTILAKEDRSKELRQRRPSVRRQLTQEPRRAEKAEGNAPVRKKKEPQR